MIDDRRISLAITNYNRYGFVIECLAHAVNDFRIDEIVISDDASTDDCYARLQEYYFDRPKVKFYRNKMNLDCYANKAKAVSLCSNPWVILFDSDNVLPISYIDKLYEIDKWALNTAYLPDFAIPHFDYREFSGITITTKNVARFMNRPHFATMLNTANYFFRRDLYTLAWDDTVDPHTADSIYQNYKWLSAGGALHVLPGLRYEHRVHKDSHYKQNHTKTGDFARAVEQALRELK